MDEFGMDEFPVITDDALNEELPEQPVLLSVPSNHTAETSTDSANTVPDSTGEANISTESIEHLQREESNDTIRSAEETNNDIDSYEEQNCSQGAQSLQAMTDVDLRWTGSVTTMDYQKSENDSVTNYTLTRKELTLADFHLAAVLIRDARSAINMSFKTDEKSLRSYILYQHPVFRWTLVILQLLLLGLACCERPALEGWEAYYWAPIVVEIVIMCYFLFRFFHHLSFDEPKKFWKDPKNITIFILIMLSFADMISCCVWANVMAPSDAVRWSRPLRPLFLINFPEGRQIRKAFRNIRRTLPDIFYVLVLFILSIAIFALMGLKLFQKRDLHYSDAEKTPYFTNYFECFWDLYVLVTTANNPDVMMPAYERSSWYALFFIVYVIINLYIFMSIVLAVVYNNYRRHLKDEVRSSVFMKRRLLGRAFNIIKVWQSGVYAVSKARFHDVMKLAVPKRSELQLELLMYVLDENANNFLERHEFLKLADLLNVPLTEHKDRATFLDVYCAPCFQHPASEKLKACVRHRYFRYLFDVLILINAFFMVISSNFPNPSKEAEFFEKSEWFFIAVFVVELVLKMYTHGPVQFFKVFWNVFDFIVILAALGALIYESELQSSDDTKERTLDFILVLRVLRLVRLMNSLPQFQTTLTTIVNIIPSITTYGAVVFVIFYMYAIIGMEIFSDLITYNDNDNNSYCGNELLNNTEFAIKGYCKNNFNDLSKSFVLLFELMVVNQWHVLSEGFVKVTNKAARLYFISFHLIVVIILVNIFTAFVLEAFILEFTVEKSKLQDNIERKIKSMGLNIGQKHVHHKKKKSDKVELIEEEDENENPESDQKSSSECKDSLSSLFDQHAGLRFELKTSGATKIDVLLQNMFEGEIDPNDEGPDAEEDLDLYAYPDSKIPYRLSNIT